MTADPERRFFHAAAWWLFYAWLTRHRSTTLARAEVIARQAERAETLNSLLADLRSFKRMEKDPHFYRAVFRGPRLRENQMQVKITAPVTIQVHQATKERWEAWYYSDVDRRVTSQLRDTHNVPVTSMDLAGIKQRARDQFQTQAQAWQTFGADGVTLIAGNPAPETAEPAAEAPGPRRVK